MPVVSFIIIGSMKSGTTTLSNYISLNNDVSICSIKEPKFFSKDYHKGLAYYEGLWGDATQIRGEASTCYSRWPTYKNVPERIHQYNPMMKFIFIMRHPAERAYSHYRHNVLIDKLSYKSFSDAIDSSGEILMTSNYMLQINKFLEYFPKKQFLLIDFDDLKKDALGVTNKMENFLGVTTTVQFEPQNENIISNPGGHTSSKRDVRLILIKIRQFSVISWLVNTLFSSNIRKIIRKKIELYLSNSKLIKWYTSLKIKKFKPLQGEERVALLLKLQPSIEELEIFWRKDLSKWKI